MKNLTKVLKLARRPMMHFLVKNYRNMKKAMTLSHIRMNLLLFNWVNFGDLKLTDDQIKKLTSIERKKFIKYPFFMIVFCFISVIGCLITHYLSSANLPVAIFLGLFLMLFGWVSDLQIRMLIKEKTPTEKDDGSVFEPFIFKLKNPFND